MGSRFSRRGLLLGGTVVTTAAVTGGVLVDASVLPGRSRALSVLGLDGPATPLPRARTGFFVEGAFDSARRNARTAWAVSYPPGATASAELPVVVSLHGRGGTASSWASTAISQLPSPQEFPRSRSRRSTVATATGTLGPPATTAPPW